jgi:protein-disulfide isomerase
MTKQFFEKFATPISIIVAGALVGGGIWLSKVGGSQSVVDSATTAPTSETGVIDTISKLPILKSLRVKSKDLAACITEKKFASIVDNDIALGQKAGLRGTPHMIVLMNKNGKDVQFPLFGAQPKEAIEQAIAEGKTPDAQASYVEQFDPQVITDADHIIGNVDAVATIIEYSDIDCPYCKQLHPTLQGLVDEGKIRWIYRHSPIPQLHPYAYVKALATECVNDIAGPDAFWKYLNELVK